jgi:phosphoribosylaminoimidazole carboxylase PurE protein
MDDFVVALIMGSKSDRKVMEKASEVLWKFGVKYDWRILSAHRTPTELEKFVRFMTENGVKIFIAGAGMAAHLAGVIASFTCRPVIAVPLTSEASPLAGMDALLSMVQMPSGIPVATVGINNAKNAAILAVEILSLNDTGLAEKLQIARREMKTEIDKDQADLSADLNR